MDEKIKKPLIQIVGEKNYTDSLIDMVSYAYDSSEHRHRPACAVWPESTKQVSEILQLANAEKVPVIPRGAGTGLSGMSVPVKGGIVLDLNHMNKIQHDPTLDRDRHAGKAGPRPPGNDRNFFSIGQLKNFRDLFRGFRPDSTGGSMFMLR